MPKLNYQVGNWTIVSTEADTISTAKTVSVADLKYATDFSVKSGGNSTDTRIVNTTTDGLVINEEIAYGRQDISDIYKTSRFSCPTVSKIPVIEGSRIRIRVDELLKATNSVTGQECVIPCAAWLNLDLPKSNLANADLVDWLFKRLIASALDTGKTDASLLVKMARGDLDPTK